MGIHLKIFYQSIAHYTLLAKSCVLQSKNEKSSKFLLLFYNVLKSLREERVGGLFCFHRSDFISHALHGEPSAPARFSGAAFKK